MKMLKFGFFALFVLLITSIFLFYYCSQKLVLKTNVENLIYHPFTDKKDYKIKDGTSELHKFLKYENGSFLFSYTLKNGTQFPFAGVGIYSSDKSNIDISKYSHIRIKFGAGNVNSILLLIKTFITGYSQNDQEYSWRYNQKELFKESGEREIKIKYSDLETPMWWFQDHGIYPKQISKKPEWNSVKAILFQNSSLNPKNKKHDLIVEELIFERSWWSFNISFFLLIALSGVLIFFIKGNKKRNNHGSKVRYAKLNIVNEEDEKFEKIVKSIGDNYSHLDFSLKNLSEDTGISERVIGQIIKKNTDFNFKRYLNKVRLKEAERLIQDTDRSINEIAYLVGYNYPSHFNRLFYEEYKKRPTELRKKHIKSSKMA